MNVAVHPKRRLFAIGTAPRLSDRRDQDIAAFPALTDDLQGDESGMMRGVVLQYGDEIGVSVILVEARRHEPRGTASGAQ
jgi:hypothetical protein